MSSLFVLLFDRHVGNTLWGVPSDVIRKNSLIANKPVILVKTWRIISQSKYRRKHKRTDTSKRRES